MEIIHQPVKKVILHQIYKYSVEELVKTRAGHDGIRQLYWCSGILYVPYLSSSEKAKDAELEGIINFQFLDYAEMKNYKEIIEFEDSYFKAIKTRVIDRSNIPFYEELITWIKTNESKKLW